MLIIQIFFIFGDIFFNANREAIIPMAIGILILRSILVIAPCTKKKFFNPINCSCIASMFVYIICGSKIA